MIEKLSEEKQILLNEEVKNEMLNLFGITLAEKNTDEIFFTYSLLKDEKVACVYFIRNSNGQVKIGKTKNLRKRLKQVSATTKNYANQKVYVERLIIAPEYFISNLETEMHHFYKEQRLYGEWFDITNYTDDYAFEEDGYSCFELSNGCNVYLYEDYDHKDRKIIYSDFLKGCTPGFSVLFTTIDSEFSYKNAIKSNLINSLAYKISRFCEKEEIRIESFSYENNVKTTVYIGDSEWETYTVHKALLKKILILCEILKVSTPKMIDYEI